ncbi:MAG: hypothetical protein IPM29_12200 [Planctomycetes bacterium]|nr:hypothetical protein [Planctomycetota bacterium]
MRRPTPLHRSLLAVVAAAAPVLAQDAQKPWDAMDYGPCLCTTVEGFSGDNVALKGRVIFLGDRARRDSAGVVFDSELLRVAAAWSDGHLELRGTPFDGAHGPIPRATGARVSETRQLPGYAFAGSFADPRPLPHGPLPREHGRFLGHWFAGDRVVIGYEVQGRRVLETFDSMRGAGGAVVGLQRTFEVSPGPELRTVLLDAPGATGGQSLAGGRLGVIAFWTAPGDGGGRFVTEVEACGADGSEGLGVQVVDGRVVLTIPARESTLRFEVGCSTVPSGGSPELQFDDAMLALEPLTHGGPRRYPETLRTVGRLGSGDGPFVVDTVTVPSDNPWKSRLRFGAFDFLDADTAALSTWNGDVWLVDGIDADLDQLTWTRFCTGLHDPLGLKVVDGVIYTHGRDGIHRLHDLNGDGECDFVEVFNNDVLITKGFHEFAFDLQTDADGNFYFSKGGPVNPGGRGFQKIVPHHGTLMRVSKDGSRLDVVMTGLRAPNGIGVGPHGEITVGDNQGTWTPACRLSLATNGTFCGCVDTAHMEAAPTTYDQPICWLPMSVDNSSGGQVWVPEQHWGPLAGQLLHQSYGQCNVYLVMRQQDWRGITQGGVVRLPADFASSQMRARFGADGNLYTVGFKGWQTRAARDTAFQRMRRTERPLHLPVGLAVYTEGIELTFSDVLDREAAEDPESYGVQVWNYLWCEAYGSPEYRPSDPSIVVKEGEPNRDELRVTSASLSADGRTVFLAVDGMQTCMQMRIGYDVEAADGALVQGEVHNTIHFLGPRRR